MEGFVHRKWGKRGTRFGGAGAAVGLRVAQAALAGEGAGGKAVFAAVLMAADAFVMVEFFVRIVSAVLYPQKFENELVFFLQMAGVAILVFEGEGMLVMQKADAGHLMLYPVIRQPDMDQIGRIGSLRCGAIARN